MDVPSSRMGAISDTTTLLNRIHYLTNGPGSPHFYGSGHPAESDVRGTPLGLRSTDSRAAGAVLPGIRFKATLWGLPKQ